MAEPGSVIAAPHTTTPSIQSIKECLRRCERLFAHNTDEQSTPEEEWTQVMTKKHRGGTRWTGGDVRRSLFSDNKAFVQGIYVVAMGFRHHAETLNKQFSPITTYQDVAFLCEASTKQVYIVNWRVLRARTEIPNSYSNDYGTGSLEREEILWLQTDWGGPMTAIKVAADAIL
ncbi:hypothetical protein QFC21_002967 [Naganishia friedmannii]|uniref:Uncharacterized protein n=1 Tax=Naganishia friedmannii TaxID=89922 RepID=A0ACC2VVE6_9TREE|nr:hypothetical protein QFC21_002967 [Naganishia friedmannii]